MASGRDGASRGGVWGWYLLLLIPFAGTLFPGVFDAMTPSFGGLPYFYWYQLLWVVITGFLTGLVYFATR